MLLYMILTVVHPTKPLYETHVTAICQFTKKRYSSTTAYLQQPVQLVPFADMLAFSLLSEYRTGTQQAGCHSDNCLKSYVHICEIKIDAKLHGFFHINPNAGEKNQNMC
jgi:hypothetical protein